MYSCNDCKCCPVRLISCRQHATRGIYWTRQRKNSPDPTKFSFHVCFRVFVCVTLLFFLLLPKNDYYLAVVALRQPLDSFSTEQMDIVSPWCCCFTENIGHRFLYNFSLLPVTWTTQSSCSSSSLCALRLVNFFVGLPSCSPAHLDMYHVPSHLSPAFSRRV